MKILLEVNDSKAAFIMGMLNNFKFVKATKLTESKSNFLQGLKESVDEVKLAKKGQLETTSLNDFLDEI